ncbi:hypothetical protein [Micromonospora sp. NBC_00389]
MTTKHRPATDLGYLLVKHPDKGARWCPPARRTCAAPRRPSTAPPR